MTTWIDQVIQEIGESESPPKYFIWTALNALAAVLKDSVWLNRGGKYDLYPNIFTILTGPSGVKKGLPILIAKRLVNEVDNTRIFSGRLTIQKMIAQLSVGYTREGKEMIKDANCIMFAPEFSSFISRDPEALTILTDIYDTYQYRDAPWINYTKKDDKEKLTNPCINLFGASNQVHLQEVIPNNAVGGGFVGRTYFVVANEGGRRNALVDDEKPVDIKKLAMYLHEVAKVKGRMQWSLPAIDIYKPWYEVELAEVEKKDETGTFNRIGDSVLKLAMLHSIARDFELIIREEDIKFAIDIAEDVLLGVKKVTMGSGRNPIGQETAMVIRFLLTRKDYEATREEILSRHWGHFDTFTLDKIVETLTEAKHIQIRQGGKIRLADKVIQNYEERVKK